jgi:hypothetical protein
MERNDEEKSRLGILFTVEEATKIVIEHAEELKSNNAAVLTDQVKFALESIGTIAASRIYKQVILE